MDRPMPEPTFVFDDDGTAYAYLDGKIIASASDVDVLESKLAFDPHGEMVGGDYANPDEGSPMGFGQDQGQGPGAPGGANDPDVELALQVLEQKAPELLADSGQEPGQEEESAVGQADLPAATPDTLPQDSMPPRATHVETPNGLKGQILGTVKGLWGDQVTIRLENGRIAKFDVSDGLKYTDESTQKTASASSPLASIQARLDETPDGTKASLVARLDELKKIKTEASALIRTRQASDDAHEIVVLADHELHEVHDALEALQDAEPYAPPESQVFEQESVGGGDASWLDNTINELVAESESTDFDQMIDEEPGQIVAEIETPALQDAEGVQQVAASRVASATVGIERDAVNDFKKAFLARVEQARVAELKERDDVAVQQREASTDDYDGPDEALFL